MSNACCFLGKPSKYAGSISACCQNKQSRNTTFGYKWRYKL